MEQQTKMAFMQEGGLQDEGGQVEPTSGNDVPIGALKEEVADDVPAMVSEGEFIFPADVVRYIGLNTLMQMRQDAKQGLKMMEEMGQMGNSEEATLPDDMPFGMADLMIVGTGEPEEDEEPKEKAQGGIVEMQTGGLFDDPRFVSQGKAPPTFTEEDKKEIEDSLLGTVYANIVMKRFVDADGNVKYIPHIDGKPQMPIPEGFTLDESAPTPKSNVGSVGTGGDSGRSDDSGGTMFTPDLQSPFADQGTESFDIKKLGAEELIDYYGSFSSPINRFLTVGVGALFGGVPALGIAAMQQLAQNRGPNSLRATEDLISQMIRRGKIKGDLLEKLKEFQKRAKEKGTAPKSFLSSLIDKVSKGDEQKKGSLEKAIETGDVSSVSKEVDTPEVSRGEMLTEAILPDLSKFKDDIDPQEEGAEFIPAPLYRATTYKGSVDEQKRPQTLGVPSPERQEQFQTQREARAMVDDINRATVRPEFSLDMTELRAGAEALEASNKEEDLYRRGFKPEDMGIDTADKSLYGRGFTPEDIGTDPSLSKTKKRTRKADQPSTGILPRRGERFPDVGLDKPSKLGQTRVDDFMLGVQRDDKGNVANLTEQQQKNIRSNVQEQENIRQKVDAEDRERQSRGFGPMNVQERFARQQEEFTGFDSQGNFLGAAKGGMFYVGGVPTKPMKPQTLKKGGLATPKVKPKRMKKGGLASKK